MKKREKIVISVPVSKLKHLHSVILTECIVKWLL